MSQRRQKRLIEEIFFGIAAISLLAGIFALGLLPGLSRDNRAIIIIVSNCILFTSLFGLAYLAGFRKRQRKRVWERVQNAWIESARAKKVPEFTSACRLSDVGLKQLAVDVYLQMGYRIIAQGCALKRDICIKLINPEGRSELVYCKQWLEPVGLRLVQNLKAVMDQDRAVRGFIWAPGGFSAEAISWVQDKHIVLADNYEIGRLVDSVQKNNSNEKLNFEQK